MITDQMRAAVGRQLSRRTSFPVTESDIRRWALAVYYPEPPPSEFVGAPADSAVDQQGGVVAPQEFNPFAWITASDDSQDPQISPNNPDRIEIILGIEEPGLSFMLNGGIRAEYGARIRPGDVIKSVTRIASYHERQGRLGLMLFTVTEDTWTNQRGEIVKCSHHTLIRY